MQCGINRKFKKKEFIAKEYVSNIKNNQINMYLLGVDIGSSSEKVAVFDYEGNLITVAKTDYPIYEEKEGWAEQNADDYYLAFLQNLKKIEKAVLEQVTAICICGQTPTDVFVDRNGEPLRRAIMWRDTRAKEQFQRQKENYTFEELEKLLKDFEESVNSFMLNTSILLALLLFSTSTVSPISTFIPFGIFISFHQSRSVLYISSRAA